MHVYWSCYSHDINGQTTRGIGLGACVLACMYNLSSRLSYVSAERTNPLSLIIMLPGVKGNIIMQKSTEIN